MRASHVSLLHCFDRVLPGGWMCLVALSAGLSASGFVRAAEAPHDPHAGHAHAAPAKPVTTAPAGTQPAGPTGKIACDAPEYNFPETWSGEKVEHVFILKNVGEGVLEISRVQPSCGCTLAGDFDRKIEPGKTGKVPIALRTDNQRGPQTKTITVYSNDPSQPQFRLTLKGTVKSAVDVQPLTGFSWATINPQSPDSITVTLTNNLDQPWALKLAPESNPRVAEMQSAFDVVIKETEPGKKAEAIATLKKPLKEGSTATTFTFATGLTRQPEVKIHANYYLPPALQAMPASVNGFSLPNQEYKTTVTVTYTREGSFKILEVVPSDPEIQTQVNQPIPTDNRRYQVSVTLPRDFTPSEGKGANLQIKTDKTDLNGQNVLNGVLTVPIHVRPQVIQPTAQQMIGKPAPQFTLKTPAGADVTIGSPGDHITVVNFWATWCGYCKRQLPVVAGVHKKYASKGVQFINVSVDAQKSPKEVEEASKSLGSAVPIALDPKVQAAPKWGARGWPALFVLNKKGVIEAFHSGAQATLAEDLGRELDLLLAGKELPRTPVAVTPATRPTAVAAPATPQVQGPSLQIDNLRQELGQRKPGETAQYSVNLRNNGTAAVEINEVKAGSAAVKVAPDHPKSIAPGAAAMVKVEIQVPEKPGTFQESLTIRSSDPRRAEQTVTLAGTVRKYVEVQTQAPDGVITFPRNPRTLEIPSLATLVYNGPGTIEYSQPASSSPRFEASIEPIANGPYSKLIVKAKQPLEQGENNAILHIKTNCKQQPELEVPVRLFLPARVEVSPKEVLLNPTGRLQRQMVSIRNNGDRSLNILAVQASSKRIHTQFYPESDGLSYKLMVTVPAETGSNSEPAPEKVTIRTDDPEFGEIVIPIKFSGSADARGAAR